MIATCWRRWLRAVLVCAALSLQSGFLDGAATGKAVVWGSPTMRVIENGWDLLAGLGSPGKVEYVRAMYLQHEFLRRCLSDEDLHQLAGSCASLPARSRDRSQFANDVLALTVKVYIHAQDWDGLTRLLSTRCPRYTDMWDSIQFYLAKHGGGRKRSILVLGDAYSRCQVAEVRQELAGALRRAFAGFGIKGKDDADYVENAMLWYKEESEHLVVNDTYFDDEPLDDPGYDPGDKGLPWNHWQTLFKRRTGTPATPARDPDRGQAGRGAAEDGRGLAWPESANGSPAGEPMGKLEGAWEVTAATVNGNQERSGLGLRRLAFDMNTHTGGWIGEGGKIAFKFHVKLGSPQEPRAIDLLKTDGWESGVTMRAIYELRGDSLRICFPDGNDQWLRPTSFRAEQGSCETSMTFRRLKD